QNFPMEGMPPAVREKFTGRLANELRSAAGAHPVDGPVRVEIADLATGTVMATVAPSGWAARTAPLPGHPFRSYTRPRRGREDDPTTRGRPCCRAESRSGASAR